MGREIKGLGVGVYRNLAFSAVLCTVSGCTVDGALHEYLSEVFPGGSTIKITESCGGTLGLTAAVAVFEVGFAGGAPTPDMTLFTPDAGVWTREGSLQEFAEKYDFEVGISATVLDGKDCLTSMRDDAKSLLFEPQPGLYFRSHDQSVIIMMPDDEPGTGLIFAQGR